MNRIIFFPHEVDDGFLLSSDRRYIHITKILKSSVGDCLKAGILDGPIGTLTIEKIDSSSIQYLFKEQDESLRPHPITLILGAVRPITMKRIIKDLTTLGIQKLLVVAAELTEKSYFKSNLWQKEEYLSNVIEGLEQAGTTISPIIERSYSVKRCLENLNDDSSIKMLLDLPNQNGTESPKDLAADSIVIAIGPERGWSDNERKTFHCNGYIPFSLGPRVLRTETAATAAVSIVKQHLIRHGNFTGLL